MAKLESVGDFELVVAEMITSSGMIIEDLKERFNTVRKT